MGGLGWNDEFGFSTDSNTWCDVFVHDRNSGVREIVIIGSDGVQSDRESSVVALTNGNSSVSGVLQDQTTSLPSDSLTLVNAAIKRFAFSNTSMVVSL